jgi:hypothetical protein
MKLSESENTHLIYVSSGQPSTQFRILAVFFILTGIAFIFKGWWYGVFIILPFLFLSLYKEGVVFDLKKHTISRYYTILHYTKIYETHPLRNFKYLSIVRVGLLQTSTLKTINWIDSSIKYRLTMIKDQKNYFKVTTSEYFKVFSLGKKIAIHFNLGLVDYSKGYANWVIPLSPKSD